MKLQLEIIALSLGLAPSRKEEEISLLLWPLPAVICRVRVNGLVQQASRSFWLPVVEIEGV